jgi:selenium metabolism protein YedF
MDEIDARQLACPGPVLTLRDRLDSGAPELRMLVADELARSNVTRFASSRGASVSSEPLSDGGFAVHITASASSDQARDGEDALLSCDVPEAGLASSGPGRPQVVQVASSAMGAGDDELGELLMRSFLKTQRQLDRRPDLILFYSTGVHLCCEGSTLLDDLHALVDDGVEILACGTCLNFFGRAAELRVGRVTDMLEIATRLAEAGSIVRP